MEELRVPRLNLAELGISNIGHDPAVGAGIGALEERDPIFSAVKAAFLDGYAGVILRGPPGTSKSWYAKEIAQLIAGGNDEVMRFIQFHPSYQYEDFMEGWVPNESGGFEPQTKVFLNLCAAAEADPSKTYVLVIDELSRADAARVFGEALTYLETSKRGMEFQLSSGRDAVVPHNLVIIATMNPWDRGVDEIDVALLRRFAQIELEPNVELARQFLVENSVDDAIVAAVEKFFIALQKQTNPMLHIGHAYFRNVRSEGSLLRLWRFQLWPHFQMACRLEPDELRKIAGMWKQMVLDATTQDVTQEVDPVPSAPLRENGSPAPSNT